MNILIIGNGFDLAHGLPTKYSDYVDQIAEHQGIYEYLWETQGADNEKTVLYNRIRKSVLFKYIEQQREAGWVDFENELRRIIEGICELENCLAKHSKKWKLYRKVIFKEGNIDRMFPVFENGFV